MNIYICSLLSKKNFKFLNSHLKSLSRLKIPGNCKLKIIFVLSPKIRIAKSLAKNFLNKNNYSIIESTKDNIPDSTKYLFKISKK